MTNPNVDVFDKDWKKYDSWYDDNHAVFQSELRAISKVIPAGYGLEIGAGTGRFSSFFQLPVGIDPAFSALRLCKERNISAAQAVGEELPFKDRSFHFVLIVATLCFVDDPMLVLAETHRVLKEEGTLICAILNRSSPWGRSLQHRASQSLFIRTARFYESREILHFLRHSNFRVVSAIQTLFLTPEEVEESEEPQQGNDRGGFVVFEAIKESQKKTGGLIDIETGTK
jgi:ubiquinone/menaquinone biosynthesis C-methylase UbiE